MSNHKPRKRRRLDDEPVKEHGKQIISDEVSPRKPPFPLVAFLLPARGNVSQWVTLPAIMIISGLFRWAVGFWPYSGFQSPPMHGDFEAQRHWMEITTNLPISQWYFHDLEWWGLDYPPLTAYHSWVCGKVGSLFNPAWFALYISRRLDDLDLKLFMRSSALLSEYLVYTPAIVILLRHLSRIAHVSPWESAMVLVAVLMQPATILIDHGHFQYNTVMLGFFAASIACLMTNKYNWACVNFVAALGFKQMALFYAPAVFAYLLGSCVFPQIRIGRLLGIAVATVMSFVVLFAPLLLGALVDAQNGISVGEHSPPPLLQTSPFQVDAKAFYYPIVLQLAQSIHRIFPFARGLFEDKVANLWCAIHTFHKLHQYPQAMVQRAALAATSLAIVGPCLVLFLKPEKQVILRGFATTAWGFFLCSYQVHEKNVLLPLLPMTLILGGNKGFEPATRAWVGIANILGCWTMYPLLKRDHLQIPYFVLTLLWAYLLGLPPTSLSAYTGRGSGAPSYLTAFMHGGLYLAMIAWHFGEAYIAPPVDKPDLWVVANVLVGAAGFGLCYLWCLYQTVMKSGLLRVSKKAKTH